MRTDGADYQRVRLLVEVLPAVAMEKCFALKGGTAINLFFRDLPRLSVDIDLTYLPDTGYEEGCAGIDAALRRIRRHLASGPSRFAVTLGPGGAAGFVDTLHVERDGLAIKIEVNPVLRGSLLPVAPMSVRPAAEEHFGFARTTVMAREEVYAGKLVAALDRQHPRDLYDVMHLLDSEGLTAPVFRTFLVYLAGHKGVIAHTLKPRRKDITRLFAEQLQDMAAEPVSLEDLLDAREQLIGAIHNRLGEAERAFLLSVKRGEPDGGLIGLPEASKFPAIRWKVRNLARMSRESHAAAVANLERVLGEIR